MRDAAVQYFTERSVGISMDLLTSWEAGIAKTERLREEGNRKAIDILKARTMTFNSASEDRMAADSGNHSTDVAATDIHSFWIQLALDIEEQQ